MNYARELADHCRRVNSFSKAQRAWESTEDPAYAREWYDDEDEIIDEEDTDEQEEGEI